MTRVARVGQAYPHAEWWCRNFARLIFREHIKSHEILRDLVRAREAATEDYRP